MILLYENVSEFVCKFSILQHYSINVSVLIVMAYFSSNDCLSSLRVLLYFPKAALCLICPWKYFFWVYILFTFKILIVNWLFIITSRFYMIRVICFLENYRRKRILHLFYFNWTCWQTNHFKVLKISLWWEICSAAIMQCTICLLIIINILK